MKIINGYVDMLWGNIGKFSRFKRMKWMDVGIKQLAFILVVLTGSAVPIPGLAQQIEVLDLQHRPALEVLPLIKPTLQENESASADGFRLLVRSDEARIEVLKSLLQKLDVALRSYQVAVRFLSTVESDVNQAHSGV